MLKINFLGVFGLFWYVNGKNKILKIKKLF